MPSITASGPLHLWFPLPGVLVSFKISSPSWPHSDATFFNHPLWNSNFFPYVIASQSTVLLCFSLHSISSSKILCICWCILSIMVSLPPCNRSCTWHKAWHVPSLLNAWPSAECTAKHCGMDEWIHEQCWVFTYVISFLPFNKALIFETVCH